MTSVNTPVTDKGIPIVRWDAKLPVLALDIRQWGRQEKKSLHTLPSLFLFSTNLLLKPIGTLELSRLRFYFCQKFNLHSHNSLN